MFNRTFHGASIFRLTRHNKNTITAHPKVQTKAVLHPKIILACVFVRTNKNFEKNHDEETSALVTLRVLQENTFGKNTMINKSKR